VYVTDDASDMLLLEHVTMTTSLYQSVLMLLWCFVL